MVRKDARLDATGQYRYTLEREWARELVPRPTALTLDGGRVLWIMLNPSIADWELDDPTVGRCVGFSRAWGYHQLTVVNLFAHRSTKPDALADAWDPVGPDNDRTILEEAARASRIVAAWGIWGGKDGRNEAVLNLLAAYPLHHLGRTKWGHPKHPLYVPASTSLSLWADRPSVAA